MPLTGCEFYDRLSQVCNDNGTSITAFLVSIGKTKSAGTYLRKRNLPDMKIAEMASERFSVSRDWLIGISEVRNLSTSVKKYELFSKEASLIDGLRSADPRIAESIYKMAFALLEEPLSDSDHPQIHDFSSTESESFLHLTRKRIEGDAAAGTPITAVPGKDSTPIPPKYSDDRFFVVRARGDSMVPVIPNGALCVFNRDGAVDDGRIVLVQIDGQTDQPDDAIKRIYRRGSQVELRSINNAHKPMFYPASDVQIAGVFVDVLPSDVD